MKVNQDFSELLACLTRHGVRALVVGAHALAFHARPRYTKDLDVFVEPTAANAARLLQALDAFGFGGLGLTEEDFSSPGKVVQLGYPPSRIDLMTSISGVSFREAWEDRVPGPYGELEVAYIGRKELVRNKAASGRTQDRADLELLQATQHDTPQRG